MSEFRTIEQLVQLPRGNDKELRIEVTESTGNNGAAYQFVSLRVFERGSDGTYRPGRQGLTIRKTEIFEVGKALKAALEIMNGTRQPAAKQPIRQTGTANEHAWDTDGTAGGYL